jgi:hypothetical protein
VFKEYERDVKERIREKGNYADELEKVLKKHDKTEKISNNQFKKIN